jgi:hypothetical protein
VRRHHSIANRGIGALFSGFFSVFSAFFLDVCRHSFCAIINGGLVPRSGWVPDGRAGEGGGGVRWQMVDGVRCGMR